MGLLAEEVLEQRLPQIGLNLSSRIYTEDILSLATTEDSFYGNPPNELDVPFGISLKAWKNLRRINFMKKFQNLREDILNGQWPILFFRTTEAKERENIIDLEYTIADPKFNPSRYNPPMYKKEVDEFIKTGKYEEEFFIEFHPTNKKLYIFSDLEKISFSLGGIQPLSHLPEGLGRVLGVPQRGLDKTFGSLANKPRTKFNDILSFVSGSITGSRLEEYKRRLGGILENNYDPCLLANFIIDIMTDLQNSSLKEDWK